MSFDRILEELPASLRDLARRLEAIEHRLQDIDSRLPPQLLTIPEAARALNISVSSMWRRVNGPKPEIPTIKHGRSRRIDARMLHQIKASDVAGLVAELAVKAQRS